jgi:hypothetical protein
VYPSTESIIALALLGVIGLCIAYSFVAVPQVISASLILTLVAGLLLIGNLMFMLNRSQAIERWRMKHL